VALVPLVTALAAAAGRFSGLGEQRPVLVAAASALIPPLDQARTVGLVTLPGALVGVLLGRH
jgi:hypothetical protein